MIRVAAVSSKEAIDQILRLGENIDNIQITPYIYENPSKSKQIVEQIIDCDVVIFAGPLPYLISKDVVDERKWPAVFIPLDEYTLTNTLFYTMLHKKQGIDRLSIDIESELFVDQVVSEFNLSKEKWYVLDCSEMIKEATTYDVDKVYDFHVKLWEAGEIDFIITSVDYVYSLLQERGIPSTAMHIPEKAVIDTIHKAITYSQLATSKSAEIAIGLVSFSQTESIIHDCWNKEQDTSIFLHQIMLNFGKQLECSVRLIGMDQFIIYGTRGSVEQLIESEMLYGFFDQLEKIPEVTINMGFGLGNTARVAEGNARIALYHASKKTDDSHSVFVVTEKQEILNPLQKYNKIFSLKSEDNHILNIANKTKMSVSTITKLVRYEALRQNTSFTAIDLETYLEISRRSTERILKNLIENNYVEKVGEEQPHTKGRPRSVYRINFN